jgi:hypothetical protein
MAKSKGWQHMMNFLLALGVYVFLFILLFFSVKVGYRFGVLKNINHTPKNPGIVKVAEGTVFALLGLLIAFTFSGAYDRFETRKIKIIDEINAITAAYHRIDLLKPATQPNMRVLIKQYVDERIATYEHLAEFRGFDLEMNKLKKMQNNLWQNAIVATTITNSEPATLLLLPALNNMFEIANTRILITRVHPPVQIFMLLIGLAALSSFLAGYNMAKTKMYSLVYTLCFVAITSFTLYVIIDLEFPRIGMIRVDAFDQFLVETRAQLK